MRARQTRHPQATPIKRTRQSHASRRQEDKTQVDATCGSPRAASSAPLSIRHKHTHEYINCRMHVSDRRATRGLCALVGGAWAASASGSGGGSGSASGGCPDPTHTLCVGANHHSPAVRAESAWRRHVKRRMPRSCKLRISGERRQPASHVARAAHASRRHMWHEPHTTSALLPPMKHKHMHGYINCRMHVSDRKATRSVCVCVDGAWAAGASGPGGGSGAASGGCPDPTHTLCVGANHHSPAV
jgi:hypothetical protein